MFIYLCDHKVLILKKFALDEVKRRSRITERKRERENNSDGNRTIYRNIIMKIRKRNLVDFQKICSISIYLLFYLFIFFLLSLFSN